MLESFKQIHHSQSAACPSSPVSKQLTPTHNYVTVICWRVSSNPSFTICIKKRRPNRKTPPPKQKKKLLELRGSFTKLGEVSGGESISVKLILVCDREDGTVELLQLHHILVTNSVQRYLQIMFTHSACMHAMHTM